MWNNFIEYWKKNMRKINKTESEWKNILSEEEYYITRLKGTEAPFSGKIFDIKKAGIFKCICCDSNLFESSTKYESGSGWPSFYETINAKAVEIKTDTSLGMIRKEIICAKCDSHLGHVFDDGPKPTGKRFCVNSLSLKYKEIE